MMGDRPVIGSKWEDPTIDFPYLRQLPREWMLEEAKREIKISWWQRRDRWAAIIVALLLLVACAQAALRVLI